MAILNGPQWVGKRTRNRFAQLSVGGGDDLGMQA
jgi:hypothetical protein